MSKNGNSPEYGSTYVAELIGRYHAAESSPMPWAELETDEIAYFCDAGLGSIAFAQLTADGADVRPDDYQLLQSSDLMARFAYGQAKKSALQVLAIATDHSIPVTLLKGISIAEQLYAEPHHRLMSDIDLMVPADKIERLGKLLQDAGYEEDDPGAANRIGHHHLPALRAPSKEMFVELHSGLFSGEMTSLEPLFDPSRLLEHTCDSRFGEYACRRFRPEFQFLYLITHWAFGGNSLRDVVSFNDALFFLHELRNEIDWKLIDGWLADNRAVADAVTVMLSLLRDTGLSEIPAAIAPRVERSARRIGNVNLRVLHWIATEFALTGRRKIGWVLTRANARTIWHALLEPRRPYQRLPIAVARVLTRRAPDKSWLQSVPDRLSTLLKPND